MLKSLIKWGIKKFASSDKIKSAIHAANAKLAEKEAAERTAAIIGYCDDANSTIAAYTKAYANDGKMDSDELAAVNARCDAMVDKYLADARIEALVDAVMS